MAETVLDIKNVSKVYDNGFQALKNVSFSVQKGEFLAVIGLSGSGKSTLLRCINRLIEPSSGDIVFRGQSVVGLGPSDLREARKDIGMVFQQFNLVKRKSVLLNVLSGRLGSTSTLKSILGVFPQEDVEKAYRNLEVVGLREKWRNRADELSGGQQQRVAIARMLMQNPELLLADEPVASLDPATSHSIMDYLELANKELGKTILCSLHFLSLVRRYATRVVALKGGEVVFEGKANEIDEAWFKRIYGDQAKEVGIH